MLLYIILLLVVGGGAAIFFSMRGGRSINLSNRLGRYGLAGADAKKEASAFAQSQHQGGRSAVSKSMNVLADRGGLSQRIKPKLERADLKMTPGEFLGIVIVAFLLSVVAGVILKGFIGILGLPVAVVVGLVGPWVYLWRRTKKRKTAFIGQLSDMAQMMGNSMRAGFSIMQSMELVGNEGPAPAGQEFERVVTEVKLGLPLEQGLEHLLDRMPSEDLELMIVAINVQRQVGGNLSEILAVISVTIRERVRFERDLKALTAQARYSSYIITALPVAVATVINFMDREYESYLYTAMLGHIMLGVAVTMLGMGFFFLNKIANIEV